MLVDVSGEVAADLEDGCEGGVTGDRAFLDEAVDPVAELGVVAVGDAEHAGDDLDGYVLREVGGGVASAVGDEPVDEVVGHGPGDGLVVGDDLWGEDREQESADVGVVRGSSVMGGAWNPRSWGDSGRSVTRMVREENRWWSWAMAARSS